MRVVHKSKRLPRRWTGHPHARHLLAETDIAVTPSSRLRAKLLVFENRTALRQFWSRALGHKLGFKTLGAVNGMACEITTFKPGQPDRFRIEVDPVYFCVIGLVALELNFEYITHESVHAAFSYANRVKNRNLWPDQREQDEESICYPAGIIAREINNFCHERGLYKLSRRLIQ